VSAELAVAVAGKRVGTLTYQDYEYSFRYDSPRQLDPRRDLVSLTMPVRPASYETQTLPPPFQSVLPEGDLLTQLRSRFGKALNLDDDFNLLRLVGQNTIGRLTFSDPPEVTSVPVKAPPTLELAALLRHSDAAGLLEELLDTYGIRSGVGGVQPKALAATGRQLTVTSGEVILKVAGADFPLLPVNEYFCLRASRAAGIRTAQCHLSKSHDLLVIERFDRTPQGQALAFEEVCALALLGRHGKYQGSYEGIAGIIRQIPCHNTPQALETLFRSVVLAMATRNGDAHLKNFGVIYESAAKVDWAPAYDLVTTTVYLSKDVPALELGGRKAWADRGCLEQFGLHACDLRRAAVRRSIEAVRAGLADTTDELRRFGRSEPRFAELTSRMAEEWTRGLQSLQ
jgi:serine/threonine-protein kinase HipA